MIKTLKAFYSYLIPDLHYSHVLDIDFHELQVRYHIYGLIFDLDNTLLFHHEKHIAPEVQKLLIDLQQFFVIAILSNNFSDHVFRHVNCLNVPWWSKAYKPISLTKIHETLNHFQLEPQQTAIIGNSLWADIIIGHRTKLLTIWVHPRSHFIRRVFL